jgi:hypothetical protein
LPRFTSRSWQLTVNSSMFPFIPLYVSMYTVTIHHYSWSPLIFLTLSIIPMPNLSIAHGYLSYVPPADALCAASWSNNLYMTTDHHCTVVMTHSK